MVFDKRSDLIAKPARIVAALSFLSSAFLILQFGLLGGALSNLLISSLLTLGGFEVMQGIRAILIERRHALHLLLQCLVVVLCYAGLAESGSSLGDVLAKMGGLSLLFGWLLQSSQLSKLLTQHGLKSV